VGYPVFLLAESSEKVEIDVTHRDLAKESVFRAKCRLCGDAILSPRGP
jgi:hypothetical protein